MNQLKFSLIFFLILSCCHAAFSQLWFANGAAGPNSSALTPLEIRSSVPELSFLVHNTSSGGARTFLTSWPEKSSIQTDKDFTISTNGGGWSDKFIIKNNGYVGIGAGTASARLHINQSGNGWADGLRLQLQSNVWDIVSDDSGNRLVFSKNQNVTYGFSMWGTKFGIGTLNPAARLSINQLGGNWEDGIRMTLDTHSWDVVADANGERLLITRDQSTANGISIFNGQVGIGTANPDAKLAVKGDIHTREVRVDMTGPMVPDYVFEKNYDLPTLAEVETYINQNKHLPEVPAAKEMEANGVKLGEMNMLLLKKVEELTLYIIKQNAALEKQNEDLKKIRLEFEKLKSQINALSK